MAKVEEFYVWMEEVYGLETILEQNDIEPWQVIEMLVDCGMVDLHDYVTTSLEAADEEDSEV